MVQDMTDDNMDKQSAQKRNIFVDALAILFGISSWMGVTSVYLQLPLIVENQPPEGWALPSYMAVFVQSANICSFAYILYQKYSPKKIDDGLLIYITLFIGCVAAICMAEFYDQTAVVMGKEHSVALMVFCFMFAMVGCLSSVLFMPYMGRFRECYLVSYMLGMCLNGFLSSIMTLIQGVGGPSQCIPDNSTDGTEFVKYNPPPLFGIELYFIIVFIIMVVCSIAFVLLNTLSICRKEYAAVKIGIGNDYTYDKTDESQDQNQDDLPEDVIHLSLFNCVFLLLVVFGLSGFGNGLLPGLISYFCLPYGNVTYHWAVALGAIAQPCAGLVALFLPHTSIRIIRIFSSVGTILAIYIVYIATRSPSPPMQHSMVGSFLIVSKFLPCISTK